MGKGSPDYTRRVKLYAWNGTDLVPVLVDDDGRIVMVPYGTATIEGDVDVTQVDNVREIQGVDGVTLRTIAVDNAGNIVGVLKGLYGTELKTIKVDSEGRMIALITDELDIYNNKVIVGNAELAVRLGSPKFFDRRGDVLFMDIFENGFNKWRTLAANTGSEAVLTADRSKSGGYSAKLVGGSITPWYSVMWTALPYSILSKCGIELHFCMPELIDKMLVEFMCHDGTNKYEAIITYDRTNQKLQYQDSGGVNQDIVTSFTLYPYDGLFHALKLVADFEINKYHRLIVNETTYDLSAYGLQETSSPGVKELEVIIYLYSRDGYNDCVYIDNIIVTQNEP